jgi:hypothetical protein
MNTAAAAWLRRAMKAAALLAGACLMLGCAATPPDRYYRLVAIGEAAPVALTAAPRPAVAVAAVSVPELVDRPQIVTLGPGSEVRLNEQHRWAEPLKLAIGRLVADRLSQALGGALVSAYPAEAAADTAYRVSLNVQRFDSELGVAAHTTVLWTVRRLADGQQRSGRSALHTVPAEASHDALAAAHAQALGRIADEIARALVP